MRQRLGNKQSIFFKIFFSYIIILVIPLITSSMIYFESIRVGTEEAEQKNLMMLEQIRDIIDTRLREIEAVANQIAMSDEVISILNTKNLQIDSKDYFRVWDLCNNMPRYKLTNNLIFEFYIFLRNSNITITSGSAFCDTDTLYGKTFQFEDLNFQEWKNFLWKSYRNREYFAPNYLKVEGQNKSAICFMQSIPYDNRKSFQGVITILIDESVMRKLLQRIDIGDSGLVYISDGKGRVISSVFGDKCSISLSDLKKTIIHQNSKEKLPIDNIVLTETTSFLNKWTFVSAVPEQVIMSRVNYIRNIIFFMLLISLLFGIIAAVIITYPRARILKNVIYKIKEVFDFEIGKDRNEFNFLDNAISKIINNNINLQQRIKEQVPLLEAAFLRKLIHGEMYGSPDHKVMLNHTQLDIKEQKLTVLIICIGDQIEEVNSRVLEEYDLARVLVKEVLKSVIVQNYYLLDLDERKIAALLTFENSEFDMCKANLMNMVEQIYSKLSLDYGIETFLAIGDIHQGISFVHTAYTEANHVLDYKRYEKKSKWICFKDIPMENNESYFYPVDVEMQLMSMVKYGNSDNVKEILRNIYLENFEKRRLSSSMVQQLVFSMRGTIIRTLGQMFYNKNVKKIIEALDKAQTIDEVFNYVIRANLEACQIIYEQKKKEREDLLHKMVEFIEISFQQNNISVSKMADEFGFSEAYTYNYFKDGMGITFAEFLENLRIRRACEYLASGNIHVKDISEMIGYSSDNSFRRAFKRVVGVSPSEYGQVLK